VAESTGKRETGILPVADEPPGAAGDYGADRVFAHLPDSAAPDQQLAELARALARAGHPVLTVPTAGPADLGRVFLLWELAVAVAGWGLQINPFDQPNVQQAKDATKRVLEEYERSGRLPEPPDADDATVAALLGEAFPPQYVALMGYTRPSPELDDAIAALRAAIRARGGATTTFGYGPRFLHSTGQYHKGGPRTGVFLEITAEEGDEPIPGEAYGFRVLHDAQAAGDYRVLAAHGLRVAHVHVSGDADAGLSRLAEAFESAVGART